jgi:2-oxoglutarate ferredoxin oxidoreductase subunit delta
MAKVKGEIVINSERCKGCQLCVPVCQQHTIAMSPNVNSKGYQYATTVNDDCNGCINCALVCPDGVITVYRVKMKDAAEA